MEQDRECGHERNYVTPMGGLEGLYQRCRRCLGYWHWCHSCEGVDPSTCLFNPDRTENAGEDL